VPRTRKQLPPLTRPHKPSACERPSLLELDRFSAANLEQWQKLSADLDELNDLLYSGVEPQRRRHYDDMVAALQSVPSLELSFSGWTRLVSYRFCLSPLSAAGSLTEYGGRFNIGMDVDKAIRAPWPALYIGENFETVFREKFQLDPDATVGGLSPDELALTPGGSFTAVNLDGHLMQVFDLEQAGALDGLCKVLRKMKMPAEARKIQRRLKMADRDVLMVQTSDRLLSEVLVRNWRVSPVQFGLPAISQILAGIILDAGFEAIRFRSTKGGGSCLAVFPHKLSADVSHVVLTDAAPPEVEHGRLDMNTADALCGWELLRPRERPEK
jgi:hypothetical protein